MYQSKKELSNGEISSFESLVCVVTRTGIESGLRGYFQLYIIVIIPVNSRFESTVQKVVKRYFIAKNESIIPK